VTRDLVFIASAGRTGTAFLGRNLDRVIGDCHSEHEPDLLFGMHGLTWRQIREFGLWHMLFGRLTGQAGVRVLGQRLLTGGIDAETARRRLRRSRARYHAGIPAGLVIESHFQWWLLAGELARMWPEAKLIGIVRDPRDWIRSWLNHGGRYDRRDRAALLPPGRLTPAKLGQGALARRWDGWGTFGKLAWEWAELYGRLTAAVEAHPAARMWRFEDLFGPDPAPMAELVRFAADHGARRYPVGELAGFTAQAANASRGDAPDWRRWSPAQAALVEELCGPLMARWGYGAEPEWRALAARGA
jgi:hypothetical protein